MLFSACDEIIQIKPTKEWYVVTMKSGFTPINDSTVLNSRKDMLARYDQHQRVVRDQVRDYLKQEMQLDSLDEHLDDIYTAFHIGFSIFLTGDEAIQMIDLDWVDTVIVDEWYDWVPYQPDFPSFSTQVADWGVTEVGSGDGTSLFNMAWIIDTGIDQDHPDLNVSTDLSRSMFRVGSASTKNDQDGHGTHVAGIIAAKDNAFGSKGIAAGAQVAGVKVIAFCGGDGCDRGNYRKLRRGLDYVRGCAMPGDVVNMSIGLTIRTNRRRRLIRNCVQRMGNAGIFVCSAAGNDSQNVGERQYPAAINGTNVYTVSAMDNGRNFAGFSNFGAVVDYCEPGVNNYSTYKDGTYAMLSGTSMASPHLAGILLLKGGMVVSDGTVNGDPDGDPDPIGVVE